MRFFVFLAIQRVSPTAGRRGHCASMPSKNPKNGRERLCRSLIFFFLNPIKAQETFALPIDNLLSHFNMVLWSVGALRRARSLTIWDRRSAGSGDKLNRQRFCLGRSGSRPSSRKWLISMIISDNSGKFQMFLGRVVACFGPSKRRHQKEKKHSGTAAGEVCPSPVEVHGASNRTQSKPIKPSRPLLPQGRARLRRAVTFLQGKSSHSSTESRSTLGVSFRRKSRSVKANQTKWRISALRPSPWRPRHAKGAEETKFSGNKPSRTSKESLGNKP